MFSMFNPVDNYFSPASLDMFATGTDQKAGMTLLRERSNMRGMNYHGKAFGCIRFECFVNANPPAEIQWRKDGILLTEEQNPGIQFSEEKQVLMMPSVSMKDQGRYTFTARNQMGVVSDFAFVELTGKPWLWVNVHGPFEDKRYEITCRARSEPRADIKWLIKHPINSIVCGDDTIVDEHNIESSFSYTPHENGSIVIECIASNAYGAQKVEKTIFVTGIEDGPPSNDEDDFEVISYDEEDLRDDFQQLQVGETPPNEYQNVCGIL